MLVELAPTIHKPCQHCYGEFGKARWCIDGKSLICDFCSRGKAIDGIKFYSPPPLSLQIRIALRFWWYRLIGKYDTTPFHAFLHSAPWYVCLFNRLRGKRMTNEIFAQ